MARASLVLLLLLVFTLVACADPKAPPGPQFEETVVVTDEPVTVDLPSGASISLPARVDGESATITIVESSTVLQGEYEPLRWLASGVQLTSDQELGWPDDAFVELSFPIQAGLSSQALDPSGAIGVLKVSRDGEHTTFYAKPSFDPSSGRLTLPAGLVLTGWNQKDVRIRLADNVDLLSQVFWPAEEGIFRVKPEAIPKTVLDAEDECELNPLSELLTPDLGGGSDTAIVMVHGWQAFGERRKGGDNIDNRVHCTAWITTMSYYRHQATWEPVRADTDLFTFRYNSNHRIAESGAKLATALTDLHEAGYTHVVLLAHSMGSLVSVEARQRLRHPDFLTGIVTLGTPLMGGVLECTQVQTANVPAAGGMDDYCTRLEAPVGYVSRILNTVAPADGSDDLTQFTGAGDSLDNPYLQRLWADNENFDDIYAIYGDSSLASMAATFDLKWAMSAARLKYGHTDGAVPVSSALASKVRKRSAADAEPFSELGIPAVRVGRDHGQLLAGCTTCTVGRNGDPTAYDPYFDDVAAGLAHFLPTKEPVVVWTREFGAPGQYVTTRPSSGMAVDTNGNIVITGRTEDDLTGENWGRDDVYVRKYDTAGNVIWTQQFGSPGVDEGMDVAIAASGDIFVVGRFSQVPFIGKLDSSGAQLWIKEIGTNGSAQSIAIDGDGNLLVTGSTGDAHGHRDVFVSKLDSQGSVLWTKQFGTPDSDEGTGVAVNGAGTVAVTGIVGHWETREAFLNVYAADGELLWSRSLGPAWDGGDVAFDSNDLLLVVVSTWQVPDTITKLSTEGDELWVAEFEATRPRSIATDIGGNIFITGTAEQNLTTGEYIDEEGFIRKYTSEGFVAWTIYKEPEGFGISTDAARTLLFFGESSLRGATASFPATFLQKLQEPE